VTGRLVPFNANQRAACQVEFIISKDLFINLHRRGCVQALPRYPNDGRSASPGNRKNCVKVSVKGNNRGVLFQRPRDDLLSSDACDIPISPTCCVRTRIHTVRAQHHVGLPGREPHAKCGCRSSSGYFPGRVFKVGCGKRQCLPKVFRLQFRIIPEEVFSVWIQRHSLYNPPHSQPHPAYTRLAVHLVRVPCNSVEGPHHSYFDTFPCRIDVQHLAGSWVTIRCRA
jgi:hypothetical protein